MYFIPRNNKLYAKLVITPLYMLYGISLGVMVMLVGIWWTLLYTPLNAKLHVMQLDYSAMTYQQSLYPRISDEVQRLEQANQELKATISRSLQDHNLYAITLDNILSKGIEAGLGLVSCIPTQPHDKGWYTIHPVEVQFSGTFDSVQKFLKILALHDYPLRIQQIALTKQHATTLLVRCSINLIGIHDAQKTP